MKNIKVIRDESVTRCPHCDRPYLLVSDKDGLYTIVTHKNKCEISFEEDAEMKMRLKVQKRRSKKSRLGKSYAARRKQIWTK